MTQERIHQYRYTPKSLNSSRTMPLCVKYSALSHSPCSDYTFSTKANMDCAQGKAISFPHQTLLQIITGSNKIIKEPFAPIHYNPIILSP
ncbi:hypothetical protein GDO81_005626 [Engystomops pustulosus]|uniref:Uncharacterized protein n=1 Tax=Engystomops pustulosus TaxID=76066 RepID=A0AAV7CTA0_ENGPU|nr:hypothetical protein GDO81_005626 [Engystomops pustulosus]